MAARAPIAARRAAVPRHPALTGRRRAARPALMALAAGVALAGCSEPVMTQADRAELRNIKPSHVVPKSSPAQLVNTFRAVCVDGPTTFEGRVAKLRDLSYVPTRPRSARGMQYFVVDDRRPSISLSARMCIATAEARTGQSERFGDYVARAFPGAQPLDPATLTATAERAWQVTTPRPGIIASTREPFQFISRYSLVFFDARAPETP
ncbi:MAG: hypothetical protein AAF092_09935 [Pseudomonadota bacterium]